MITLPVDYFWSEYHKSLKVHITPKNTKNKINMALCGLTETIVNKNIQPERLHEKYYCKRCLYVLWTYQKMWVNQLGGTNEQGK